MLAFEFQPKQTSKILFLPCTSAGEFYKGWAAHKATDSAWRLYRASTTISSLQCQKRQALICTRVGHIKRTEIWTSTGLSPKGAVNVAELQSRGRYFFHPPAWFILYLLFISVRPQSKTDGSLPDPLMC